MRPIWSAASAGAVVAGLVIALALGTPAGAADRDLEQGLQHLRSGNYPLATRHLALYRDHEADAVIRARVEQALVAMQAPGSPEAGVLLASSLEDSIRAHLAFKRRLALDWRNRSFPPFP